MHEEFNMRVSGHENVQLVLIYTILIHVGYNMILSVEIVHLIMLCVIIERIGFHHVCILDKERQNSEKTLLHKNCE